ncbi:MAG TPA: peptidase M2 family protein, partial [Sphingomicrobium sp.]
MLSASAAAPAAQPAAAVPPPPAVNTGPAPTAAQARDFIARVEKDLYDFSVISGRAAWVNATYITDDTDALNAYFGTIGTEKTIQYAKEAARYVNLPGLDPD